MEHLPFRQVHLDFHTSECIQDIGRDFDKAHFQSCLKKGHVEGITLFAKCHHGWMYYPSEKFHAHPNLRGDLLGQMIEACREIGVKTQIYVSAGWDEVAAREHPGWRADNRYPWKPAEEPAYVDICLNSGYLDYLAEQVREVLSRYQTDGLSMDICVERICVCETCRTEMRRKGFDPQRDEDVAAFSREVYKRYYTRINNIAKSIQPDIKVYHNGYVSRGRRDLVASNDYYQVESLPTGGWGYDLFPLAAGYAGQFGQDVLGMTGKFHTHWGEFGGYKTGNALKYEASLALAMGARCSIGDQMHPLGRLDDATYELIGQAYEQIDGKEPWCVDAQRIADIGLMSQEAMGNDSSADIGANRILLEGHYLYRVLDCESDFSGLKVIILPDTAVLRDDLANRLREFVKAGGKLLATGTSGLLNGQMAFDLGCHYLGESDYYPSYLRLNYAENIPNADAVVYAKRHRIACEDNAVLAYGLDPYFNRTAEHHCSHLHAPADPQSAAPAIARGEDGIYVGWDIFTAYKNYGSITTKLSILPLIDELLGDEKTVKTGIPAQGIVTYFNQPTENRYVLHLLYASPVRRGGRIPASRNENIEVIEDLIPIFDIPVCVQIHDEVVSVRIVPEGIALPFERSGNKISFIVPQIYCHTMVEVSYRTKPESI